MQTHTRSERGGCTRKSGGKNEKRKQMLESLFKIEAEKL